MHRIAPRLILAGAALFLIAAAAPAHRAQLSIPKQQPSAGAGLRGAQAPAAVRRAGQTKAPPQPLTQPALALSEAVVAPAARSLAAAPLVDSGQCRRACARPYYFCLSGDNPDSCSVDWSRCVSSCDTGVAAAR